MSFLNGAPARLLRTMWPRQARARAMEVMDARGTAGKVQRATTHHSLQQADMVALSADDFRTVYYATVMEVRGSTGE